MNVNQNQTKKIFFILTIILVFNVLTTQIVQAGVLPVDLVDIDVESVLKKIEERYHINRYSVQNQAEYFNVSDTKKEVPQVLLTFNPSDPKPGEKITAEALPMYFSNATQSLYFTWYLRKVYYINNRKITCDKNSNPDKETKEYCDRDGNGKIDENDWKIEAMRLITNAGFDTTKADYSQSDLDKNSDSYEAIWGGDNKDKRWKYFDKNYYLTGSNNPIYEPSNNRYPHCYLHDFQSGENYELASNASAGISRNLCRHLFPLYNDFKGEINMGEDDFGNKKSAKADLRDKKLGDGSFRLDEEIFWKTNPSDPDTADNGKKDEANAVGLGINTFTWNYSPGDKVGVAIEGSSMIPTKHDDSTMMIMWALPKNKCDISNTSSYTKVIKGYDVIIPTTETDINSCLGDNLVDPKEEGHPSRINLNLSYSPENPNNDPQPLESGENAGDILSVSASTSNPYQESIYSEYDWKVYLSSNGTPDPTVISNESWKNITQKLIDNNLLGGPIKGNGLNDLKIKLALNSDILGKSEFEKAFPSGIGYLKINLVVREYFNSEIVREGKGDVIVKIMSSGEKLIAYIAKVNNSTGKIYLDNNVICQNCKGVNAPFCYVVKNEIIGVEFKSPDFDPEKDNYSWTINGKPLNCNSFISDNCSNEKQKNINFFPITEEPGATYEITLTVTKNLSADESKSGKTITLNRTFQVVEPFIKIEPDNNSVWKKYLGSYVDLNNKNYADFSESVFETPAGNNPILLVESHPDWLISYISPENIEFNFDEQKVAISPSIIEKEAEQGCSAVSTLAYLAEAPPDDKEPGSVYNANVKAVFYIPNEVRQALKNIWNISQFETGEYFMSDSVQVEVVEGEGDYSESISLKKPIRLIASLITYIPREFTFLVRIFMTVSVIILTTGIVFSLTPEGFRG